jgi:hypothetical protein
MQNPLKRVAALQPISRQHHKALQCCFKIRKGLDKDISIERISSYVDYFFEDYYTSFLNLKDNVFKALASEELYLAYLDLKKDMLHLRSKNANKNDFIVFEKHWYRFIRWQERILLEWIQDNCSTEKIEAITGEHPINEQWCEYYTDKFWED